MDIAVPEGVQQQLKSFEEFVSSMEDSLKLFTGLGASKTLAQLPPLERAQTQLALAQAAHALLQLFLRASGVDPAEHESRKEQERLRLYAKKVRKVWAEKELRESRRSLEINVGAVNRFISAAVPDLSSEQKAALKRAGQEGAAKRQGASAGAASAPGARGGGCCGGDGTQDAADAAEAFLRDTLGRDQGGAAPQQQQKKRRRS